MLRNTLITFNPRNPDEQELIYDQDPAYEFNCTEEELMHERIQRAMMRVNAKHQRVLMRVNAKQETKDEQQGQTEDVQSEDRA